MVNEDKALIVYMFNQVANGIFQRAENTFTGRRAKVRVTVERIERSQGRNVCSNPEGCDSPTRCQSGCTHTEDK